MSKRKNKFIFFIIFLIILVIGVGIYNSFFAKQIDRNSYVVLIEGEGELNSNSLEFNSREKLAINDLIKTTSTNALAIIEWGDGSVTRMGGNSEIIVNELFVSDNKEKLNISFELLNGKTWSNVISFIGEDSYFKQNFEDTEAAVRGTIFNVNLEKDYLYVVDHLVSLTDKEGNEYLVEEKQPFNLNTFSFIALQEYIMKFKDRTFEELNRQIDKEFLNNLKVEVEKNIKELVELQNIDLSGLKEDQAQAIYNEMLAKYQEINFIRADEKELFDLKVGIKEKLIKLASKENKEALVQSTIIDLKDSFKADNLSSVDNLMKIISSNNEFINKDELLNILKNNNLSEEFKNIIKNNIGDLEEILGKGFETNYMDIVTDDLIKQGSDLGDKADSFIKGQLDNLINK